MHDSPLRAELSNKYLAAMAYGTLHLARGNFEVAERLFQMAQTMVFPWLSELVPLTLYSMALLRLRQGQREESQRFREQAAARIVGNSASSKSLPYLDMIAEVLIRLGEYRRAIPFCEQAIQLELAQNDPIVMAEMLLRAGLCYGKSGLAKHAEGAFREAVKILRNCPGDPRLGAALIGLGNNLQKKSPAEAEGCYREAAELHTSKGELQSATVPWSNLGNLCSRQGRHAEALEFHQQVLKVREGTPGTSRERLGIALNNIASCYGRMGKFAEAHQAMDRAVALLEPGGGLPLASAYGTRGLIFQDEGKDTEAVAWLQKAYAVQQKVASPNLETVAEDLEREIAALRRLGRVEEAEVAADRLRNVRARMQDVQPVERDLSTLKAPPGGAVLIELGVSSRSVNAEQKKDLAKLIEGVIEAVEKERAGSFDGGLVIPESTTLTLYGPDAEALFRAVEPVLKSYPVCQGAIITVRQNDRHRQVVLPRRPNEVQ